MTIHTTITQLVFAITCQFIELIAGPGASVHFRLIHDTDKSAPAFSLYGTLADLWPHILEAQAKGYGVFVVINEGGNKDSEITRIRAVFVDADDIPIPETWQVRPDFIVQRDETHWHAYWRVLDLPVDQFRTVQKRLATHYGTDPAVCNPSRVMRIPGTLHQKGTPTLVKLINQTGGKEPWQLDRSTDELTVGLPPLLTTSASAQEGSTDVPLDLPANVQKAREYLKSKPAVSEGERNTDVYETACWLYDHALSQSTVMQLMMELWRSNPPFDEAELAITVASAAKARQNSGAPHASRSPSEEYAHLVANAGNQPVLERRDNSRMDLISADEAEGLPEPLYRVEGIIPDCSLVAIYGRSGSLKSFILLEFLLATATGTKAFGKYETKQAPTVLCVGEAVHGTAKKRVPAWRAAHGQQSNLPFFLVRGVPIMGTADIEMLAQKIREKGIKPGIVGIDTAARSLGAMDENAAASMNLLVAACERLIHEFDCTVILVHHAGKDDSKGARGSSALHAAVDAEFVVRRVDDSLLTELACTKMKDSDEPEAIALQGRPFGSSLILDTIEQENYEAAKQEAKAGISSEDQTAFVNECARIAIEAAETGQPLNRRDRCWPWVYEKLKDAGFRSVINKAVKSALATATHRRLLRFETGGNRRAAGYYPWHEETAADLAVRAKNRAKKEGE